MVKEAAINLNRSLYLFAPLLMKRKREYGKDGNNGTNGLHFVHFCTLKKSRQAA